MSSLKANQLTEETFSARDIAKIYLISQHVSSRQLRKFHLRGNSRVWLKGAFLGR